MKGFWDKEFDSWGSVVRMLGFVRVLKRMQDVALEARGSPCSWSLGFRESAVAEGFPSARFHLFVNPSSTSYTYF